LKHYGNLSKIKVTATSLKNVLLQHHEATTLVGLSDVLTEFNIPNLATRISPEQLYNIPLPAIAHFDTNGGIFVTITKVENDQIEWIHEKQGIFKESIHEFIHKWQGVTLLAEPNENAGEPNYKAKRTQEILESLRVPFILGSIFLCLIFAVNYAFKSTPFNENGLFYAILTTKFIGLVISTMLIWHSIDADNSFLKNVCQLNKKTNCNNILNSDAAKLFGLISWSEIGLFYYAGGFISLLVYPSSSLWFLSILAVLALPYTFWSIYYQAFVAKEWCPLCLGVQVLIWIEFLLFLKNDAFIAIAQNLPINLLSIGFTFVIVPVFWAFIKKPLQKSQKADSLLVELQKLKFNPDYVQTIFNKKTFLPPIFEGMKAIEMGNPLAENTLTLIINPVCTSCRHTYLSAKKVIQDRDDIKLQFILAATMAQDDEAGQIARTILSQQTIADTQEALDKWFMDSTKNMRKWLQKIALKAETQTGQNQMALHIRWLELAEISEAPITFFNESILPKVYLADDLSKLINKYHEAGFANQK
jgi:uncharacterized membrane protein/preprotein translocase subunit YajC